MAFRARNADTGGLESRGYLMKILILQLKVVDSHYGVTVPSIGLERHCFIGACRESVDRFLEVYGLIGHGNYSAISMYLRSMVVREDRVLSMS